MNISVGRYHGTTVEPQYFFLRYQYRRCHGTIVVSQYHIYRTNTAEVIAKVP